MTDTAAAIGWGEIVRDLEPIFVPIVSAAVTALIAVAVNAFAKWTGVKIDTAFEAKVQNAAATEAAALVAAASDNLATASIKIGDRNMADAANRIIAELPEIAQALGLSAGDIEKIVIGEIGKLQARMTAVDPAKK
jgi:hypothetical protein